MSNQVIYLYYYIYVNSGNQSTKNIPAQSKVLILACNIALGAHRRKKLGNNMVRSRHLVISKAVVNLKFTLEKSCFTPRVRNIF